MDSKISAVDLIVSIVLKRPAQKEQHPCADKAYDASEVREFAAEAGYTKTLLRRSSLCPNAPLLAES